MLTRCNVAVFLPSAGLATRMQPFSRFWPKSALPILGVPSLELCFAKICRELNFVDAIHINTHAHVEQMRWLIDRLNIHKQAKIQESFEPQLLGSVGGLIPLKSYDYDYVIVVNPDVIHTIDLKAFFEFHLSHHAGLTIAVGHKKSFSHKSGDGIQQGTVLVDPDGQTVRALTEPVQGQHLGVGCYVYSRDFLDHLPSEPVPCEFRPMVNAYIGKGGLVSAYQKGGQFFDFGDNPKEWFCLHTEVLSSESMRRAVFSGLFGAKADQFQSSYGAMQITRIDKNDGEDFVLLCSFEPDVSQNAWNIDFAGKNILFAGSGVSLGELKLCNSFVVRTGKMFQKKEDKPCSGPQESLFKLEGEFCNTIDVDTVCYGL